jgi:hypothetical protein
MKMVLRTLSIALTVISVFLVLFAGTALYSVMQMQLAFGALQGIPIDSGIIVALPFTMDNQGLYDVSAISLSTNVTVQDQLLPPTTTPVILLASGHTVNTFHNLIIFHNKTTPISSLLFTDAVFPMDVTLGFTFGHVIPVQLSMNLSVPWGAPLANFQNGPLTRTPYNATHLRVSMSLRFDNHAVFDLIGTVTITLLDRNHVIIQSQVPLEVASGTPFDSPLILTVSKSAVPVNARVRLSFATNAFLTEVQL